MKNRVLLLHDYRGFFAGSLVGDIGEYKPEMMNLEIIKKNFEELDFKIKICELSKLDMNLNYAGWNVIYASSEDQGLFYKSYIEDILLKLELDGATLIPSFIYFRAHHNKVFAELIRKSFSNNRLQKPASLEFGNYTELMDSKQLFKYPLVIKMSAGAGSTGVRLIYSEKELKKLSNRMFSINYNDFCYTRMNSSKSIWLLKTIIKSLIRRGQIKMPQIKNNKLIVQDFIKGLDGDYKVLYFMKKYYVIRRQNRKNDFRASGSGKLSFESNIDKIKNVLNFAKEAVEELKMPMCSLDIGYNGQECFLIEFQCVHFGTYTLQFSPYYFVENNNLWKRVDEKSILEVELVRAISEYIIHYNKDICDK